MNASVIFTSVAVAATMQSAWPPRRTPPATSRSSALQLAQQEGILTTRDYSETHRRHTEGDGGMTALLDGTEGGNWPAAQSAVIDFTSDDAATPTWSGVS